VRYLLDTDTCILAMKSRAPVLERLLATARADVAVSAITVAELKTGAAKSSVPAEMERRVNAFIAPLAVVPFDAYDASAYAVARAKLERAGLRIGPLDTLIAAQALARGMVVVSNNEREFRRVPGLEVENWAR